MINLTEKLKIAMIKQNVTQIELAKLSDQTQSNLSQKFTTNNFKLSEYQRLVEALGCTLDIAIVLPNGERIQSGENQNNGAAFPKRFSGEPAPVLFSAHLPHGAQQQTNRIAGAVRRALQLLICFEHGRISSQGVRHDGGDFFLCPLRKNTTACPLTAVLAAMLRKAR